MDLFEIDQLCKAYDGLKANNEKMKKVFSDLLEIIDAYDIQGEDIEAAIYYAKEAMK